MASHPSFEGNVLDFEPEENPPWRREGQEVPPVGKMVTDIVQCQEKWNSMKENCDAHDVKRQFMENFLRCNREHSCMALASLGKTRECLDAGREVNNPTLSSELEKQKESVDLEKAYIYLRDIKPPGRENDNRWLIEESMLQEANRIILKSASTQPGCTEPGIYSTRPRFIDFEGECYHYQNPDNMQIAVTGILEKFNFLFKETNNPEIQNDEHEDKAQRLCKLYKACGWLVFEMLDLHPFGDGNGRLCRLLCSYVLSTCTPFPTPVYNIWSTSCKYDYMKALVQARKPDTARHPRALVTMIIECSWYGWKEFLERLTTP